MDEVENQGITVASGCWHMVASLLCVWRPASSSACFLFWVFWASGGFLGMVGMGMGGRKVVPDWHLGHLWLRAPAACPGGTPTRRQTRQR